ncbi:hypothetical protein AVEN_94692-1 [Araneus ventricosus]|uniref:Uncharacterized protein n=1 Tax=Araneus ventricosus TaxID=182803 RepID=A0A4Y2I687_ARAVE|nr:hypothetical protein AVEN_94692-1 [Araneus ventricosus]
MVVGVEQTTFDNISRRHKLSYELKIDEIRWVVVASILSKGFPRRHCTEEKCFFDFVRKWVVVVVGDRRPLMTYLDVITFQMKKKKCRNRSGGWGWRTV